VAANETFLKPAPRRKSPRRFFIVRAVRASRAPRDARPKSMRTAMEVT
jgi:hypothetical protein